MAFLPPHGEEGSSRVLSCQSSLCIKQLLYIASLLKRPAHPSQRKYMCSHSIPPNMENLRRLQAWLFSYLPNTTDRTMAGATSLMVMCLKTKRKIDRKWKGVTLTWGSLLPSLNQRDLGSPGESTWIRLRNTAREYVGTKTKAYLLGSEVSWIARTVMNRILQPFASFLVLKGLGHLGSCRSIWEQWNRPSAN